MSNGIKRTLRYLKNKGYYSWKWSGLIIILKICREWTLRMYGTSRSK